MLTCKNCDVFVSNLKHCHTYLFYFILFYFYKKRPVSFDGRRILTIQVNYASNCPFYTGWWKRFTPLNSPGPFCLSRIFPILERWWGKEAWGFACPFLSCLTRLKCTYVCVYIYYLINIFIIYTYNLIFFMLCVFFNTYSTTISKFLVSHSLLVLSGSLILPCLVPNVCIYNYIFWIIYSYNLIIFVHFLVIIFLIHILFGFQNTCISLSLISSHNLHFPFCFIFTSSLLLKSVKHLQSIPNLTCLVLILKRRWGWGRDTNEWRYWKN